MSLWLKKVARCTLELKLQQFCMTWKSKKNSLSFWKKKLGLIVTGKNTLFRGPGPRTPELLCRFDLLLRSEPLPPKLRWTTPSPSPSSPPSLQRVFFSSAPFFSAASLLSCPIFNSPSCFQRQSLWAAVLNQAPKRWRSVTVWFFSWRPRRLECLALVRHCQGWVAQGADWSDVN